MFCKLIQLLNLINFYKYNNEVLIFFPSVFCVLFSLRHNPTPNIYQIVNEINSLNIKQKDANKWNLYFYFLKSKCWCYWSLCKKKYKILFHLFGYELGCFYKHYLWPFAFNVSQWKIYECLFANCLLLFFIFVVVRFALNFKKIFQVNFYVYFICKCKSPYQLNDLSTYFLKYKIPFICITEIYIIVYSVSILGIQFGLICQTFNTSITNQFKLILLINFILTHNINNLCFSLLFDYLKIVLNYLCI